MKRKARKKVLKLYVTICYAALLVLTSGVCAGAAEITDTPHTFALEAESASSEKEPAGEAPVTEVTDKGMKTEEAGEDTQTEMMESPEDSEETVLYETESVEQTAFEGTGAVGTSRAKVEGIVSAASLDRASGAFRVKLSNINLPEMVESVKIAVWSQTAGQDDLAWVEAKRNGTSWYADIDTAPHQYDEGIYFIHVYVCDYSGNSYFCGGTSYQVTIDRTKETLSGVWNASDGTMSIQLSNAYTGREIKSVRFAVWSETNGQDDLQWYSAIKYTDGSWRYTVPLNRHSGTGNYFIHAYSVTESGTKYEKGASAAVETTKAAISGYSINSGSGAFRVTLNGFTLPETVRQVRVAAWSKINGQDDLVWIEAKRNGTSWYADIDTAPHQYDEGIYFIHVYVCDHSGNSYFCGGTSYQVTIDRTKATLSGVWNASDGTMSIQLSNAYTGREIKSVRFAVWSETNGQDDLRWYSAIKYTDGSWRYTVPLNRHSGTGNYFIHAYSVTESGTKYEKGTSAAVETTKAAISTATINPYSGAFRVTLSGFTLPETVKQVRVAAWSEVNGQDDLVWIEAKRNGTGWYADIDTMLHQYDEGVYIVHTYVVDNGNNSYYCAGGAQNVAVNRSNAKLTTGVDSARGILTIKLSDAYLGRNVTSVRFPTWTAANGQDDLVWHKAAKNSDGTWTATVNLGTHNYESGTYYIHAYQYTSSGQKYIIGTTASVKVDMPYVRQKAIEILDNVGWNLRAAFNWSAGLTYYRPTPTPSQGMLHTVYYGEYGFRNGRGNCYVMAATFYWLAKELGYDVHLIEGYVPRRGGGITVHGWTEVIIDGVTYVCDPNFTNETGRNGYMITYGTSGTWMYQQYNRVDE